MSDFIYPRSPREIMDGWHYLPRYIDKIRLHLAGKLHADYQENLGIGFDGKWLAAAGVTHQQFLEVVKNSITDGEVCDWVRQNVKRTPAEKAVHWADVLSRPLANDPAAVTRLQKRKSDSGLGHRDDLKTFVDYIDADEKRL
jgi:gluconokinase